MLIKCKFCGNYFENTKTKCPICAAINDDVVRTSDDTPKTIEELKSYCAQKNLPLTKMRFFLGENYKEPKAFGIYKDEESGEFVVYKNKDTGERVIRYQGIDEAYAVNEMYLKIRDEVINQKEKREEQERERKREYQRQIYYSNNYASEDFLDSILEKKEDMKAIKLLLGFPIAFVILMVIIALFAFFGSSPKFNRDNGYYYYDSKNYYYFQGDWYKYNNAQEIWESTSVPNELKNNYDNYFFTDEYDNNFSFSDFYDTEFYNDYLDGYNISGIDDWDSDSGYNSKSSWSSDWDSGWSGGSSSWDSSFTDWGSDW